jgi:hypothetical protein
VVFGIGSKCCSLDPQIPCVATVRLVSCAKIEFSRGSYTEHLERWQWTLCTAYVEPLYIVVAGRSMPTHNLPRTKRERRRAWSASTKTSGPCRWGCTPGSARSLHDLRRPEAAADDSAGPCPQTPLFDEATSALDNRTQAIVSSSLQNLQLTRVVIAHRLNTITNADEV